jgi:putative phage-type endonuclease
VHRLRRKRYLGASDVPAVLGVSPWKTASDVYYSKAVEFEDREKASKAIQSGILLEDAVIDYAAGELGVKVKRNQFRVHPKLKWASATLDATIPSRPDEAIEAKTTSMTDQWGDEGTDQIPIYYVAQVQWQMFVTGISKIWVPCLMPDHALRFKLYVVDRDEALISSIVSRCTEFWESNVLLGVPPKDTVPAPRTIQRMKRVPDKVTTVEDHLVEQWKAARSVLKIAKDEEKTSRMKMLEQLGDAEVGKFNGGVLNYRKRERRAYTKKVVASAYRTLELREGDEGAEA